MSEEAELRAQLVRMGDLLYTRQLAHGTRREPVGEARGRHDPGDADELESRRPRSGPHLQGVPRRRADQRRQAVEGVLLPPRGLRRAARRTSRRPPALHLLGGGLLPVPRADGRRHPAVDGLLRDAGRQAPAGAVLPAGRPGARGRGQEGLPRAPVDAARQPRADRLGGEPRGSPSTPTRSWRRRPSSTSSSATGRRRR